MVQPETAQDYEALDEGLARGRRRIDADLVRGYMAGIKAHPLYPRMVAVEGFSMLHPEVLLLLRTLAMASEAPILEIGAYVGGSTVALGMGVKAGRPKPLITVEVGGAYMEHDRLPTPDILADWEKNVAGEGLRDAVDLIVGWSNHAHVFDRAREILGDRKIGLLFIDADGGVERDIGVWASALADDCLLAFDDYSSPVAAVKAALVNPYVDREVEAGRLEPFGVFGWGTWFGRRIPGAG